MNRRLTRSCAVFCLLLMPFVTGCPGGNALTGGLSDGLTKAVGSIVADLLNGSFAIM